MRLLVLFALLLLVTPARAADGGAPNPCDGHAGVVDGVDEDGVVCDAAAEQAAAARFAAATTAAEAEHFTSPPCDPGNKPVALAKLEGASEWLKAADRAARALRRTDAEIADLQALIAAEKANPAGVVSLAKLHRLGEDLQITTARRAGEAAELATDRARAKRLADEVAKAAAACKR
jgi:hypothetical protein